MSPTSFQTAPPRDIKLKMEGGGFEPPKASLTDLQSAPFGHSGNRPCFKWGLQGSNLWPSACKADALPAELRPQILKWKVVDSNHRSVAQQIYSLPPLATRETFQKYLEKKMIRNVVTLLIIRNANDCFAKAFTTNVRKLRLHRRLLRNLKKYYWFVLIKYTWTDKP